MSRLRSRGDPVATANLAASSAVVVDGSHPQQAVAVFAVGSEVDLHALIGGLHRMLQAAQCDALDAGRVVTAASELGHNILRYAGRGQITVRIGSLGARPVCELVAEDRGPGIADVDRALQDHFSTGAGLGLGLPGVRRLMDTFDLESQPGAGTRVVVRRWL
ncbi:MAG: ATP-binding protein [Deltaproteobacteria bacterium]|nr:ATP-binding protein [Deltaproteobacteria bacterium]